MRRGESGSRPEPASPAVPRSATAQPRPDGDWVRDLSSDGPEQDRAVAELHETLLRVGRREARRRASRLGLSGPEVDDVATQATGDAVVAILAKLGQFRGESRFTTWAYGFVVLNVGVAVNRHFWRRHEPVSDESAWQRLPDRFGLQPEEHAQWRELMAAVQRIVTRELTDRQRQVFLAIVVHGMPVDALAAEEGSTRNTLYKVVFDARRKIRDRLVAEGLIAGSGRSRGPRESA